MKEILQKKILKSKLATVLIIAILTVSAVLAINPLSNAVTGDTQVTGALPDGVTPSITLTTNAYLSVSPNPIGKGQTLLVNMWLHPPTSVNRNFSQAFVVTFLKPDGTTEVMPALDSYAGDASAYFEYMPDQVGEWQAKLDFLGTYFPPANVTGSTFAAGGYYLSAYYKPSSTAWLNFTVQEDQVMSFPPAGTPTDYWTRPVSSENREWWPYLGNWPSTGLVGGGSYWPEDTNVYMSNYEFTPYTLGPESAHVMWKTPYMSGGLVGGTAGQVSTVSGGLTGSGYPTIIYNGRCYEAYAKSGTGSTSVYYWKCYDLRTGEIYWEYPVSTYTSVSLGSTVINAIVPTFIEYQSEGSEVAGATAREGVTVTLDTITSASGSTPGRIIKWDPYTGAIVTNITGPTSGISVNNLYASPYVLSVQSMGGGKYRLLNWTIENNAGYWSTGILGGQTVVDDFSMRIKGNISWPWSNLGTVQDFESMIAVRVASISSNGTQGVSIGQTIEAVNLLTGQSLWNTTTDTSTGLETFFSTSDAVADHGMFACRLQDGPIKCWNLQTGKVMWTSEISDWPWGVFGAYDVQSAYGLYYTADYAGIHAINWTTGEFEWTFSAPAAPFETPYNGEQAFHSSAKIADGKYYTFSCEHTPSQPLTRGWKLYCLDAYTGVELWNVSLAQGVPGSRTFQGAIADGYLALTNEYDGNLYIYGKGPSSTTITAPSTAINLGQSIMITGKVLDQSVGSPNTPAISDEWMGQWMEYIHMDRPIPVDATGVSVSIDATDPNGNSIHIGDATSDISGTYSFLWEPELAGEYKVMATFAGTNSYGSSYATTAVGVVEGSETSTPAPSTIVEQAQFSSFDIAILVAVIVAILIGVINLMKKK
ncbi:MAG: PQQ-binding-like beta-propeller repeat protein [Candidatus Bathyarchaeia archaeon]